MGFGMEGRERGMRTGTSRVGVDTWGMDRTRRVFPEVMVGMVGMEVGGGSGRRRSGDGNAPGEYTWSALAAKCMHLFDFRNLDCEVAISGNKSMSVLSLESYTHTLHISRISVAPVSYIFRPYFAPIAYISRTISRMYSAESRTSLTRYTNASITSLLPRTHTACLSYCVPSSDLVAGFR